jgi:hypothetical protein
MTITLGFWAIPVAVIIVSLILAALLDIETFTSNSLGAGCLGMTIILCGVLLAAGLTIGHLFK